MSDPRKTSTTTEAGSVAGEREEIARIIDPVAHHKARLFGSVTEGAVWVRRHRRAMEKADAILSRPSRMAASSDHSPDVGKMMAASSEGERAIAHAKFALDQWGDWDGKDVMEQTRALATGLRGLLAMLAARPDTGRGVDPVDTDGGRDDLVGQALHLADWAINQLVGEMVVSHQWTDAELDATQGMKEARRARALIAEAYAASTPPVAAPVSEERVDAAAWKLREWTTDEEDDYLRDMARDVLTAALAVPDKGVQGDQGAQTFQSGVKAWMASCFGDEISSDRIERGDRLLEEVLELLQSGGYDPARVPMLTEYVYGRPVGEPAQEVGGVMVCVAAYCLAFGLDMHDAADVELARVWTKVEQIREKQKTKPKGSPLPVPACAIRGPA